MNQKLRTLLVLGRVSNLPTVWSNCLAGWWLGGGENFWKLPPLLVGMSLLYTGGMYLNDAFDEEFDRLRRPERPIPSRRISAKDVWKYGFGQLLAGLLFLFCGGVVPGVIGLALALSIIVYDLTHKLFVASPWLMGMCRFWVYLIAGATGAEGLTGYAVFGGLALAFYVVGLSYVARHESTRTRAPGWPLILLAMPVLLALVINTGAFRPPAIWVSLLLGAWVGWYVRTVFQRRSANAGWIVSNLLAGIVLVDWLAVAPQIPWQQGMVVFAALFGLAKVFQKYIPAT